MFSLQKAVAKGARNVATAVIAYIPLAAAADYGVSVSGTLLTIDLEKALAAVGIFVGTVGWDFIKRQVLGR